MQPRGGGYGIWHDTAGMPWSFVFRGQWIFYMMSIIL